MPSYDFECPECKHTFEQDLPMGSPVPPCPECGNMETERQISPPPVIFKGDGFYKTDSKKPAKKPEKESKETEKAEKSEKKEIAEKPTESDKPKHKDK